MNNKQQTDMDNQKWTRELMKMEQEVAEYKTKSTSQNWSQMTRQYKTMTSRNPIKFSFYFCFEKVQQFRYEACMHILNAFLLKIIPACNQKTWMEHACTVQYHTCERNWCSAMQHKTILLFTTGIFSINCLFLHLQNSIIFYWLFFSTKCTDTKVQSFQIWHFFV